MNRVASTLVVCALVLWSAAAGAEPVTVNYAAAPGEEQDLNGWVYGEALDGSIPGLAGTLQSFSFTLLDPGAGSLMYKTGIAAIGTSALIGSGDRLFESGWQTLSSTGAGTIHEIETELSAPVLFQPGAGYYLYILTASYMGPTWQLQTMGRYQPGGCCGGAIGPGLGLRTTYDQWMDLDFGYSARLNETEYDRDIAMTLYLDDGRPSSGGRSSVPEPTTMALMAMGPAGVGIARRRRASRAE
jgi:hypothetical protein